MRIRVLFIIFFVFLLSSFQVGLVSSLPLGLNHVNMALVLLVVLLALFPYKYILMLSFALGIIFDLYSFSPFGVNILTFIITLSLANFLLNNFFTDRSLRSFIALIFFSSFLNYFLSILFINFIYFMLGEVVILVNRNIFYIFLKEAGYNIALTIILFSTLHYFSNNFKPVFLIKAKR